MDVQDVGTDAAGPWATKLTVVTRDGDVVNLPIDPSERGPRTRWKAAVGDREGPDLRSGQPDDRPVVQEVDASSRRYGGQPGHRHHVAAHQHDEAGSR